MIESSSTTFENISDSKQIPVTITIKLDPFIKKEMYKEIDDEYYKRKKIQIKGFDLKNPGEIDLSLNDDLIDDLRYKASWWGLPPIADFFLKWEMSKGLKLTKNKHLRYICSIISSYCNCHIFSLRDSENNEFALSKYEEFSNDFEKFKSENVFINMSEKSNSSKINNCFLLSILLTALLTFCLSWYIMK